MKRAIFSLDAAGALREYQRLSPCGSADDIRVVVGRAELPLLLACGRVPPGVVRAYSPRVWPWLWLRLLFFLGLSRTAIICTASPHARGMKLLALALRGRVTLAHLDGSQQPISLAHFLWLAWQTFGRRAGDVCLLGTTSTARLHRILDGLRLRYPGAHIHALVPDPARELPADSFDHLSARALLKACLRKPRFATLVIPCAGDGPGRLKALAFFLPLGYREIYNENLDCYPGREAGTLLRHLLWRFGQFARMRTARALQRFGQLSRDFARNSLLGARTALLRIPDRVNVVAGASVSRLPTIVEDVRRRHPGASCHGFLTADAAACAGLFDSVTPVRPLSPAFWLAVLRCAFGRNRAGYCVLPLTREGHAVLKFVFWFLPLGRRELYNENFDLCSARDIRVLPRHFWWRMRHFWWRVRHPQRPTVTVLGTASGLFLEKIVAELRERYPGAPMHGLLPARLVGPASALFDAHTIVAPFSFACWRDLACLAVGPRRSGHFIIACTNEGFSALKLAGPWLPFGRREVFNENADSYLLRDFRMWVHHVFWRLQYRIFYQAISVRRRRSWPVQVFHLLAYPLRLVPGIFLLAGARLRALTKRIRKAGRAARPAIPSRIPAQHETQFETGEPVPTHRSGD